MDNNNPPSGLRGIAIVTGASGNLGQAVVKKFIAEGYKVIGTIIPNDPAILNFPADSFEKVVVDLQDEKNSADFIQATISKYGSINAAVLTVGGLQREVLLIHLPAIS